MPRAEAVLEVFPSIYGTFDRLKLLAEVVQVLAQPLEEADSHVFRIQRAHRLLVAPHPDDIVLLAAALDLDEFHFEDLLGDAALEHELRLELMRERVQRIARLHLSGLGTPWAVIEGAAIFLNASVVPDREGEPLVKHLDRDGFSHRATVEFTHAPGRPRERIVLHESPFRRNKVEPVERWPLQSWAVDNRNVEVSPVRIAIQGVGERTVIPTVFCPRIQAGIVFNGIVRHGETLLIDEEGGARIDDRPVDHFLLTYVGGMFDYVPSDVATLVVEEGETGQPYVGDPAQVEPEYGRRATLPRPPLGRSEWYFSVAQGVYDGRDYDFAVFDPPTEPVGRYDEDFAFDASIYDLPPSGIVGMAWDERIPCSLKLLLPGHVPAPGEANGATGEPVNYQGRVGAVLPRFRAAGIRAFVDTAAESWIVGQGVLRASAATDGEGIDFHTTLLESQTGDVLVPFDPQPSA
jgi:hypothetical protein